MSLSIFISYAHDDKPLLKELENHLATLRNQGIITTWNDRDISAGTEWEREIDVHLNTAQIILLLISADFLASRYCYSIEMKLALERHDAGEACVIPIILRPADWKNAPFGKLQVLPPNGKPIASRGGRYGRDQAFLEVVLGIRDEINSLMNKRLENVRKELYLSPPDVDNISIQKNLGHTLFQSGHYEEALAVYNTILTLAPTDSSTNKNLGHTLFQLGRYKEALNAYGQLLRLDPNNIDDYREICDILVKHIQQGDKGKIVLLLLGRTSVGKSSTINALSDRVAAKGSVGSVTPHIVPYEVFDIEDLPCIVVDTPGLLDDLEDDYNRSLDYFPKMRTLISQPGREGVLFFHRLTDTRIASDEKRGLQRITEAFGREIWRRSIIVLTFTDICSTVEEYFQHISGQTNQFRKAIANTSKDGNNVGEQIAGEVLFIPISNRHDTTPDGQKWLRLLRLAVLIISSSDDKEEPNKSP